MALVIIIISNTVSVAAIIGGVLGSTSFILLLGIVLAVTCVYYVVRKSPSVKTNQSDA